MYEIKNMPHRVANGANVEQVTLVAAGAAIGFTIGRTIGIALGGTAVNGALPLALLGAAIGYEIWRSRQSATRRFATRS